MRINENVTAQYGKLSSTEVWADKDKWVEREKESYKEWEKLDTDEREVLISIVEKGLDRLRDRVDEWLPATMKVEQGQYIDLSIRIIMTELEMELAARREVTQRQIREAAAATAELIREAGGTL